ncbi:Metabotropic glutamate receptor 5 [Bulinus truncatus]|nr:Metabotropic glutamate receptor 5 [Bulinus truncatus]
MGAISFMFYSPPLTDFAPRYESLTLDNPKNPWFEEFWMDKFNCSLDEKSRKKYSKMCTGNEKLSSENPDSKLGFVANAVMTMAHALHSMHHDLCPGHTGLCPAMEPVNGSLYWNYLLNVSFLSYNNELVQFDAYGDPPGRYEIRNYQRVIKEDGNITYEYVNIGDWKNINLTVYASRIQWPPGVNGTVRDKIVSVCSLPCPTGHKQSYLNDKCCWSCQLCKDNEITTEQRDNCTPCELGRRPNVNKTECEDIPVHFISWGETEAIVCISLACLGISVTLWILVIFLRYKDTPMVKASTRELSYIILVGICLAFSANFFIVAKPTREFCYIARILPGLSFSLMYGALVTRTNRIARILEGSKRIMTKKPKFMSATAQVVITGIIISIECAVIIAMLVYQPADSKIDYLSLSKARLICDTSNSGIVVPLGFDLVLIILCTIYAVKTRNLPENFNEAKFIGFTMYSTCVIWLGFFPIYFAGENKEITLSISMSLSAAIAILLLFIPKVYVIIWVPEKNTRGAFTTSRDVRCHIGSKSMASGDSIDIKESNTCENLYKSDKGHNKNWKQKSLDEKRLRFVMQRSSGNSAGSPYINHGVLPSLPAIVRSTAFVNRDNSSDSTRTVSTPISSASGADKEKQCSKEQWENPGVEAIRQSLVRDFPLPSGRRQLSLRPGSPAEKEKHRIHNIAVADLDELLSSEAIISHNRHGKPRDFRKSLSSNCVSTCQKTKTAECQTGEELAHFLLPPLRKRCVSRNKLERSGAVDDHMLLNSIFANSHSSKDVSSSHHEPHFLHSDPITAQRPSCKSPLVICYTQDRHGLSSLPDLDCPRSPLLTNSRSHRRSSYHQPLLHHHDCTDRGCCSNDPLPPRLTIPTERLHRRSTSRLLTPDSSDLSFLDGVEAFESSISPCYSDAAIRNRLRRFPVPGISPSSRCGDCSDTTNASNPSLLQDDSVGSLMTTSSESSSFTLPPFQTSTDSNHSLCDLDNTNEAFIDTGGRGYYGDDNGHEDDNGDEDEEEEMASIHHNATAPLMGDNSHKSNILDRISPLISLEPLDQEESEVLEFQKYLQGHGVKLDISTIQSSDL